MSPMRQAFGLQPKNVPETRGGAPLAPGCYGPGRWPEETAAPRHQSRWVSKALAYATEKTLGFHISTSNKSSRRAGILNQTPQILHAGGSHQEPLVKRADTGSPLGHGH
jgi:hypothetical protein